ncbi:MAG: hypothetical protein QXT77_09745 [Candidatus Methanomethylicaceae archaeon]
MNHNDLRSNWKGVWILEKDYSGMPVQIYRVCKKCAREMLNEVRPDPAHPTYFTRISFKKADRLLRTLEGYGAGGGGPCDWCGEW